MRGDEKLNQNNYSSNGAEGSKDIKEIELTELGQRLGVRNKEKKQKEIIRVYFMFTLESTCFHRPSSDFLGLLTHQYSLLINLQTWNFLKNFINGIFLDVKTEK